MIVGVILRNYKNYGNLNFVPVSKNISTKYSVYVGNNGVGKSGVLEAIDVILNDREWNITLGYKKDDAHICPIFLIDKNMIQEKKEIFDFLGEYFWNSSSDINSNLQKPAWKSFFEFKDELKKKYKDSHNLIMIGEKYLNNKEAYFSTFQGDLLRKFMETFNLDEKKSEEALAEIKELIISRYSYLYIPVEQPLNELLRLETKEMQMLLNKNLLNEIEQILTKKGEGRGEKSIVNMINDSLDKFIDKVNMEISSIDEAYSFTSEYNFKKKLTSKDIREKILDAYFPLKTLKRNGRRISQLSSGEQRKALIDVAYSVLVTNGEADTEKEIILAIDEPETSMHISNCFNQFMMLESLAETYGKQVILTTHWYGFLPITRFGDMHYITRREDNLVDIRTFDFYNLLEEKRNFPDVIELKSMFDLATSILTYMRKYPDMRWIVCEGSDDKTYIECMFQDNNIKILPLGGCGNVVKLYKLLYTAMTEKEEVKAINSKILFLIDTDDEFKLIEKPLMLSGRNKDINIYLRRLQLKDGEIKLLDPTISNIYSRTEIEDCLIPELYYDSLVDILNQKGTEEEIDVMDNYEFVDGAISSQLHGDDACIRAKKCTYISKKKVILQFAEDSDNKYLIAKKYANKYQQMQNVEIHKLRVEIEKLIGI